MYAYTKNIKNAKIISIFQHYFQRDDLPQHHSPPIRRVTIAPGRGGSLSAEGDACKLVRGTPWAQWFRVEFSGLMPRDAHEHGE